MDTDPKLYRLRVRLMAVIEIAKCWRNLYAVEVEKRKVAELELAKLRDISERNALGILAVTNGMKSKK